MAADKDNVNNADEIAEEFDVVELDTQGNPIGAKPALESDSEDVEASGEQDAEDGDERVGHDSDEGDVDVEKRRERRRVERKQRRDRARRTRTERDNELVELRSVNQQLAQQLGQLNSRVFNQEITAIDSRINLLDTQIAEANQVIIAARTQGNHVDSLEAERLRDQFNAERSQLANYRSRTAGSPPGRPVQTQQEQRAPAVDPNIAARAQDWHAAHRWFQPKGNDEDSLIVEAIDRALMAEGYNPKTPDYWEELTDRVEEKLPHRVGKASNGSSKPTRTAGGPNMASASQTRTLKRGQVYITPDRKKAMQESGAWDDPVKRARQLKQYQKFDAENPRNAR